MRWREPDFLLFASDAALLAFWGCAALLVALTALLLERRRARRVSLRRIGWVPWTGIFLVFAVVGGALLAVALPALLQG